MRSVCGVCEHMFVAWDNLSMEEEERPACRVPRRGGGPPFRGPDAVPTRFYEVRAKSILNRVPEASQMPFRWTINPYRGCSHACVFCFARPTHTYLDFDAGRDFEREIIVKVNAPERLRAELARPSWKGEHIALGTNTDPYQWVEGRYKLMRGIWQAMIDARNPGLDPDQIAAAAPGPGPDDGAGVAGGLQRGAVGSDDGREGVAGDRTAHAQPAGADGGGGRAEPGRDQNRGLVAPLMPGINDDPAQVAKILEMASEAGAAYITGIALHLRGEVRGLFMEWLAEHRPDLVPRYRELYRRGAYAPQRERRRSGGARFSGPDPVPWERGRGLSEAARSAASARAAEAGVTIRGHARRETTAGQP